MLKAGALYFSLTIAFFIAVISALLIMLAAHYRGVYLKEIRFARLAENLDSGSAYVLADQNWVEGKKIMDLYGDGTDSLLLEQKQWGLFDLAVLRSFRLQDTLQRAFLIGRQTDSVALYLSDEDRPLALSGDTKITGDVVLPKAGIKKAYAEGKPYANVQTVYGGKMSFSDRNLNELDQSMLKKLKDHLLQDRERLPLLIQSELVVSFLDSTQSFRLAKNAELNAVALKGNLILFADSSVTITRSARLTGIQIYAPVIHIEAGFKGNCQLFATESIVVEKEVALDFPSVLGVIRTSPSVAQPNISLGDHVVFNGIIFSHEQKRSPLQTLVSLGKETKVKGEVYSTGLVKLSKGVVIEGKVSCHRFIMQTPVTLYENFLIDVLLNRRARSRYYLSSRLFQGGQSNHILKWLD
ncbi:hypothetical protein GM921_09855 [Pedobacter sp. LMG 31464]|uniref:Uncharacterized protein n=1 Tax=Pedobacter planticolens TaxID=2679964 RepID=A0A923DXE0_9SPHI|nr:hypothetical protein [Pedobacter planticolens]MBB2145791.1 hypothetical protein [Pedobacter planticolens]